MSSDAVPEAVVPGQPGPQLDGQLSIFLEALRAKAELGDRFGLAVALDSAGRASVAAGRARRGAILLGGAASTWDAIGMRETGNPFAGRSTASDGIRQARTLLGKRAFRAEFRRGSELSEKQVVAYALGDDRDPERKAVPAAPSPLTRRETEVAELVAEGLSNPEIARRLVISVRTAQGHVENILRKLGFTSRAMIAAWVTHRSAQQGRPQPAPP